jgi:hypothetical protein
MKILLMDSETFNYMIEKRTQQKNSTCPIYPTKLQSSKPVHITSTVSIKNVFLQDLDNSRDGPTKTDTLGGDVKMIIFKPTNDTVILWVRVHEEYVYRREVLFTGSTKISTVMTVWQDFTHPDGDKTVLFFIPSTTPPMKAFPYATTMRYYNGKHCAQKYSDWLQPDKILQMEKMSRDSIDICLITDEKIPVGVMIVSKPLVFTKKD